jgi:hypothetical protein
MLTMVLSCTASDWQNSLRNMLGQKTEVDLTNVSVEFNGVYLEEIAKENGMFVIPDERMGAAFFRKKKF